MKQLKLSLLALSVLCMLPTQMCGGVLSLDDFEKHYELLQDEYTLLNERSMAAGEDTHAEALYLRKKIKDLQEALKDAYLNDEGWNIKYQIADGFFRAGSAVMIAGIISELAIARGQIVRGIGAAIALYSAYCMKKLDFYAHESALNLCWALHDFEAKIDENGIMHPNRRYSGIQVGSEKIYTESDDDVSDKILEAILS